MKLHLELRDHSEITSAAPQRPVQVGIFFLACTDDRTVGDNEGESFHVVARHSESAG